MLGSPESRPSDGGASSDFAHVDTWIFDLDNTLYSAHSIIFQQVDDRIKEYVARLLEIDRDEAYRVQKDYYRRYGTSLRGLMTEHGIEAAPFLDYVHDIDRSSLMPDPLLGEAISRLPGRRFIMTNGTRYHAEKTADRLGITHHFDDIFDIVAADLIPKPNIEAYQIFFDLHGIAPDRAAMFEDIAKNLEVPHAVGMKTILILPEGMKTGLRDSWAPDEAAASHIDFVTDDLAGFLASIAG